ncbi:MAG: hypothetical protein QXF76_01250 [Candidatus Anstonellales archaeon]
MSNENNKSMNSNRPEIQNPFSNSRAAEVVARKAYEVKNFDNQNNRIKLV